MYGIQNLKLVKLLVTKLSTAAVFFSDSHNFNFLCMFRRSANRCSACLQLKNHKKFCYTTCFKTASQQPCEQLKRKIKCRRNSTSAVFWTHCAKASYVLSTKEKKLTTLWTSFFLTDTKGTYLFICSMPFTANPFQLGDIINLLLWVSLQN